MKNGMNYKTKRNVIIIAVIILLFAFASIGSYPKNYATSNSLGYTDVMLEDGGIYNKTFTKNVVI